jgi:hypothetical protein
MFLIPALLDVKTHSTVFEQNGKWVEIQTEPQWAEGVTLEFTPVDRHLASGDLLRSTGGHNCSLPGLHSVCEKPLYILADFVQ